MNMAAATTTQTQPKPLIKHIVDSKGQIRYYCFDPSIQKWIRLADSRAFELILDSSSSSLSSPSSLDHKCQDYLQLLAGHVGQVEQPVLASIYHVFVDLICFCDVSMDQIVEILCGAYTIIQEDNGIFYERWKTFQQHTKGGNLSGGTKISSHKSHKPQWRLNGGSLITPNGQRHSSQFDLLIGCMPHYTFFQFERTNLETNSNMVRHGVIDFVYHWWHQKRKNVGPFGTSIHTEKHQPLVVRPWRLKHSKQNETLELHPRDKEFYNRLPKHF